MYRVLRGVLVALVWSSAMFKLSGGHDAVYWLSPTFYYAAAVLEVVLGFLLLTKWTTWASLVCSVFFACGAVLGLFIKGPCGCHGALESLISPRAHVFVAGILGIVASAVFFLSLRGSVRTGDALAT